MSLQRRLAFVLLVILLLASCVPLATPEIPVFIGREGPWDCTEVIEQRLERFPFRATQEAIFRWIQEHFGAIEIKGGPSASGTGYYQNWLVDQRRYGVTSWLDARDSAVVRVSWAGPAPTLADALRCLGDPPLYRAYYAAFPEAVWTSLDLWYPERGIMVDVTITHKVAEITLTQPVYSVLYTEPGPPEDLVTRFYRSTQGSELYARRLRSLQPWPGDITKITIDERGY